MSKKDGENYSKFKEAFEKIQGEDQKIKVSEIGKLLRALKYDPTEKELADYVKVADPDNTHHCDWISFFPLIAKLREPFTRADVQEAFAYLDTNKDKKISFEEFKKIMTTQGDKFTEEEADEIFQEIDRDSNGFIEYEELLSKIFKEDNSDS